jgi:archaetidylinositol phosphate synthase
MAFIRISLNALDGLVARELKVKNRKFGEVLNEITDRLSDVAIFGGLAFASYVNRQLALLAIILILLNSYLSILSKAAGGKRQYGGLAGKADRMLYLSLASILVLIFKEANIMNYLFIFLSIATIITFIQRFISTKKELYH